jgi:hypothetical protein
LGTPPREGDVFLFTVGRQFNIDELSSIVGVNAQEGKRKQVPCSFQCGNDGILTPIEQGKHSVHPVATSVSVSVYK